MTANYELANKQQQLKINNMTKVKLKNETANSTKPMLAAGLLSKGDIIVSNKNGKELSCYTAPHHVFIGNGETPIRTEYYLWDAEKKKSKKFKENEIRTMLEKNWSVKPKMIANEFENALFDLVNKFCKDGLSKPDLIKKMEYVTQSCLVS